MGRDTALRDNYYGSAPWLGKSRLAAGLKSTSEESIETGNGRHCQETSVRESILEASRR
jgi:hypothetical protein